MVEGISTSVLRRWSVRAPAMRHSERFPSATWLVAAARQQAGFDVGAEDQRPKSRLNLAHCRGKVLIINIRPSRNNPSPIDHGSREDFKTVAPASFQARPILPEFLKWLPASEPLPCRSNISPLHQQ
jgi:hypothetical protein